MIKLRKQSQQKRKAQACESVSLGASLGFEFFFFSLFTLIFIIKKIE
jgi:hypothetical protein